MQENCKENSSKEAACQEDVSYSQYLKHILLGMGSSSGTIPNYSTRGTPMSRT